MNSYTEIKVEQKLYLTLL